MNKIYISNNYIPWDKIKLKRLIYFATPTQQINLVMNYIAWFLEIASSVFERGVTKEGNKRTKLESSNK